MLPPVALILFNAPNLAVQGRVKRVGFAAQSFVLSSL
jgi:hypothetical protein